MQKCALIVYDIFYSSVVFIDIKACYTIRLYLIGIKKKNIIIQIRKIKIKTSMHQQQLKYNWNAKEKQENVHIKLV